AEPLRQVLAVVQVPVPPVAALVLPSASQKSWVAARAGLPIVRSEPRAKAARKDLFLMKPQLSIRFRSGYKQTCVTSGLRRASIQERSAYARVRAMVR